MNAPLRSTSIDRRHYVLAELRCASLRAQLARLDIETAAIALAGDVVTPDQAIAMIEDTEAAWFVTLQQGDAA